MPVERRSTRTVFDLYFDEYKGMDESLPSIIPSTLEEGLDYRQVCTTFFNFFFQEQNLGDFFRCFEMYNDMAFTQYEIEGWDIKEETRRVINNTLVDIFTIMDKALISAKSEVERVFILNEFNIHLDNFFNQQNFNGENQLRFRRLQPEFLKKIKRVIKNNLSKRRKQFELETSELHFHLPNLIRTDNRSFQVVHDLLFEQFLQSRPGDSKTELFAFFKNPDSVVRPYNWIGSSAAFVYLFRVLNGKNIIRYRKGFWPELKRKFVLNGQRIPDTIQNYKIKISDPMESSKLRMIIRHFTTLTK